MAAIFNCCRIAIGVTVVTSSCLLSTLTSHRVGCWLCGNPQVHPDCLIRTLTLRYRSIVLLIRLRSTNALQGVKEDEGRLESWERLSKHLSTRRTYVNANGHAAGQKLMDRVSP